ncbi:DUF4025 domain-containing protein [Halalkalibacter sp. AB-rgal2]|uniref:DUF4025 domain-containing protein n=1 Tax=Halalkalibacter sp. AB-rgal2 TaxID=3242695 RepID=UPI00359E8E7D|nr:YozQ family protein [Halalkalibacter sp. APA_J-10(15)]
MQRNHINQVIIKVKKRRKKGIAVTHEQVSDTLTEGTIEYENEAQPFNKKDK